MSEMIKDYEIVKELGRGSYAVAYLVSKTISDLTKEYYVIKQINLEGMTTEEKDTLKNEANILSKIKSEFVVKFYESFEENNCYNIVMEYCEGGDLEQLLIERKKIPLNENFIWKVFIQIVIGLGEIHKMNILHRDIKTSNIFLTKNNDVKIGDLGIAKQLIKQRYANTLIGTPYYLSPEICKEKPYNEKSDIWALGCILYELCTFEHPFDADNQIALIKKILNSKPKPISNIFDINFNKIIMKLLQKDMSRRPSCQIILKDEYLMKKAKELKLYKKYQKLIEYNFSLNKPKKTSRITNFFTIDNNNKNINTKKRPISNRNCRNNNIIFNNNHINKHINVNPFLNKNNEQKKKPIIKNKSKKKIIPEKKEKNLLIDTLDRSTNRFKMAENIPISINKEVSKINDNLIKITPDKEDNIKKMNYRDIFNSNNDLLKLSSNQSNQDSLNKMLTDFEQYQVKDFSNNSPNPIESEEKVQNNEKNSDIKSSYFHIYNNNDNISNNKKEDNYLSESEEEEIDSNKKEYDESENENKNEVENVTVKIYNIDNDYYNSPPNKKEGTESNNINDKKMKILNNKENNYYISNMKNNENQNEIKNEIKKVDINDSNNNNNCKNKSNKNIDENTNNLIKKIQKELVELIGIQDYFDIMKNLISNDNKSEDKINKNFEILNNKYESSKTEKIKQLFSRMSSLINSIQQKTDINK